MPKTIRNLPGEEPTLTMLAALAGGGGTPAERPKDPEAALPLAVDGASDYVIVRAAGANGTEAKAADEFRKYFALVTGASLPVVTDDLPASPHEIVIGKTDREKPGDFDRDDLTPDGFTIRTDGDKLWLVGGADNGTLYAVYEFLESYLGCRFYTVEYEKIPERKNVSLFIRGDTQRPVFDVRSVYNTLAFPRDFADKRKVNSGKSSLVFAQGAGIHSLPVLAGTGDGKHGPDPCLTDDGVFGTVMASIRKNMAATPGANYVSVSQCDGGVDTACHCGACMARVKKYGWSGHYLLFINRVAEELKKDYPDARVHTFAYTFTMLPPKGGVRAADNVIVQLCVSEPCLAHSFLECKLSRSGGALDMVGIIRGWGDVCRYIQTWTYTVNFKGYCSPYPNWPGMLPNTRLYAENNVKSMMYQGCYTDTGRTGEFDYLRCYLQCRLAWDPLMPQEKYDGIVNEFLADYYGPGWRHIRDFMDFSVKVTGHLWGNLYPDRIFPFTVDKTNADGDTPRDLTPDQLRDYRSVDWEPYYDCLTVVVPHPILSGGYAYFDEALAEAETDGQRFNIERSRIQLDYIKANWLQERLAEAKKTVMTVYENALNDFVASGVVSAPDASELKAGFREYIGKKLDDDFVAYNTNLARYMLAHKVECFREHEDCLTEENVAAGKWNFDAPPSKQDGRCWFRD